MANKRVLAGAVVVVLLAASAAAQAAQAAPATYDVLRPQLHGSTALSLYLERARTTGDRRAALRSWQVDAAAAAGVPTSLLLAAQAAAAPAGARLRTVGAGDTVEVTSSSARIALSLLHGAGDLDGDGTGDVLDIRYAGSGNGPAHVATIARAGSTGRVLWHRTDAMPAGHFLWPMAAPVGSPARPGVVLLDSGMTEDGDSAFEVSQGLVGLAGRTGRVLWRHAESGKVTFSSGFAGRHVPSLVGLLQMTAGAKDALLTITDFDESSGGARSGSTAAYRVSGATGVATRSGAAVTSGDSVPQVDPVSDVSGDGRDDYVVLVSGGSPRVEARRALDGTAVWTSTSLALTAAAYAESAGRLTGTRVEDVAVATGTPGSTIPTLGTPVGMIEDPTAPAHGQVGLLRGGTGALVWQQTGDGMFRVLRAGPDRVPALGVSTAETSSDSGGTTETLHLMAYDVAGSQLYDRAYSVRAPADGQDDYGFGLAGAWTLGDFGPDGAQDGLANLVALRGDSIRERFFLFDGATGAALPGDHLPLFGSLTGGGDDLVDVAAGSTVLVTALRGRDRHRVFATRLRPSAPMQYADAYAERLVGRCGDVLVNARGKSVAYTAVLTATGRVRWSIEHGTSDLRAGAPRLGGGGRRAVCA